LSAPSAADLPPELRAFLNSCVESIDQAELLLVLRGSVRRRSARDVSAEMNIPIGRARQNLERLAARGLLDVEVGDETEYGYKPKSVELARYCDLLAQYYINSRQAVLGFIAAESRLSVKRFADAFKLRDPEK
jgi:hypothetical protein